MKRKSKWLAIKVACPKCGAEAGRLCIGKYERTRQRKAFHRERHQVVSAIPKAVSSPQIASRIKSVEWQVLRAKVFAEHGAACIYCGKDAHHVDHKTPLSRGGSNDLGNLVPSCGACNMAKGTQTFEEFTR